MRLGSNVRRVRSARTPPLSQERLASAAGLHRNEIHLIERGAIEPRLSTLVALADGLGVSIDELLGGIEPPVEPSLALRDAGRPKEPRRRGRA